MNPLMLYIHIPFCEKKCHYCDFLSSVASPKEHQEYVDTLCKEIALYKNLGADSCVSSIFFGGGTPSILSPLQIEQIMASLKYIFPHIKETAEITLELNPGTADKNKLETYRRIGINRLSIGLQASNNEELKNLGRIHTYETFIETYELARNLGFTNINIDIMSAIPGQAPESWIKTLEEVIALEPEHISAYSLIVEEDTPFYDEYSEGSCKYHLLPGEEDERQMYYDTKEKLELAGYRRYEISNYAKPGKECRHNLGYWEREPYLGLGLGASSLLKLADNTQENIDENSEKILKIQEIRRKNHSKFHLYKEQIEKNLTPVKERETLDTITSIEEFMFLGLRKIEGIDTREFHTVYYENVEKYYGVILDDLYKKNLVRKEKNKIFLTNKGVDLSNVVLSSFLI